MKLKLTKSEMQELEHLLDTVVSQAQPKDHSLSIRLLVALLEEFYIKVATKIIVLNKSYSFKISPAIAIAFVLFFENKKLNPALYHDNLILKLINQIKQHYA
jgi:hypothetical protein